MEEAKKSNKFFKNVFFKKRSSTKASCSMSSVLAINLLNFKSELIINASQAEKEVKLDKSEYDE